MRDDPIGEALGVDVSTEASIALVPEASEDEKVVRQNLYELIETAKEAVGDLSRIAQASQDNESYSSLASLLRTAGQLNKNLLDVGNSFAYRTTRLQKPSITNQTLVLTTTELQRLLENKAKD
jgi:hypothetical protein